MRIIIARKALWTAVLLLATLTLRCEGFAPTTKTTPTKTTASTPSHHGSIDLVGSSSFRALLRRGAVEGSSSPTRGTTTTTHRPHQSSSGLHAQSMATESSEPGINLGLIAQSVANQALIGSTIWTGGIGYQVLTNQAQFGLEPLLFSLIGFGPLLALSRTIESSDSYALSGLNLSTNMAVLRMFGTKPNPVPILILSALLAGLTGIVEETTFRGMILPYFANRIGDGDIMVGAALSTLLFAFLHTNPIAFFKGGDQTSDSIVLFLYQCITGSIFCSLYLATGNLAVPILTHALFDFYTFFKVHMVDVAGQIDYAKNQSEMPMFRNRSLANKWAKERGKDFLKGVQQTFYLMDTNRDGVLSQKELKVALFSYGINMSELQSKDVYQKVDADNQGKIDLDEFLAFVGPEGSTGKAVRNTLVGPL